MVSIRNRFSNAHFVSAQEHSQGNISQNHFANAIINFCNGLLAVKMHTALSEWHSLRSAQHGLSPFKEKKIWRLYWHSLWFPLFKYLSFLFTNALTLNRNVVPQPTFMFNAYFVPCNCLSLVTIVSWSIGKWGIIISFIKRLAQQMQLHLLLISYVIHIVPWERFDVSQPNSDAKYPLFTVKSLLLVLF